MPIPVTNKTERFMHVLVEGRSRLSGQEEKARVNLFVGGYFDIAPWLEKFDGLRLTLIEGEPPPPLH